MVDLMALTITGPDDLTRWLTEMVDLGMPDLDEIDPVLAVIRDETLIASGFILPPTFTRSVLAAFYGFAADVVAVAFDSAIYIGETAPAGPPRQLVAEGHPDAYEALFVQWLDRRGPSRVWQRRYDRTETGVVWSDPDDLNLGEMTFGPLFIDPGSVIAALDTIAARYAAAGDVMDHVPQHLRDRSTAAFLGLELR
jgi:hypothetical protein